MIFPPSIKPGDNIKIVSPAGAIKKEHLLPAIEWMEGQGYKVELGKHVFEKHFQFAGTKEQRMEDLQNALDDPDVAAIICSRGGYGMVQIVEELDFRNFGKHPKWLVGFSDITVLHNCLNSKGYASIHGVMPRYFFTKEGKQTKNLDTLFRLLSGQKTSSQTIPSQFNIQGNADGELVGGNLSLVCSLLSTKFDIDMQGKILFIEDINEYLYKVDRMMHQLKLSGKLMGLRGLVVGEFTDMKDNSNPYGKSVEEIILDAVKEYAYPVCFNFPAGHGSENLALQMGGNYQLSVSEKDCKLTKL